VSSTDRTPLKISSATEVVEVYSQKVETSEKEEL
jgi:hypothetical protein